MKIETDTHRHDQSCHSLPTTGGQAQVFRAAAIQLLRDGAVAVQVRGSLEAASCGCKLFVAHSRRFLGVPFAYIWTLVFFMASLHTLTARILRELYQRLLC